TIEIGANVKSLGRGAFEGCFGIKEIRFLAESVSYCGADVFLNAGTAGAGIAVFVGKDTAKIPAYLFSGAQNVTSVTFETGAVCESIGEGAFASCTSMQSFTIPKNIKTIGKRAFAECSALTAIDFCAISMADLASDAFAFENAGTKENGITVSVADDVLQIPAYLFGAEKAFLAPNVKAVIFSENSLCASIGEGAFAYLPSLASFEAPSAIERVGIAAFTGCESLPFAAYDNAYYLGNEENPYLILVKSKDTDILSCQLHADTAAIAGEAFALCASLESISLPMSLAGIGDGAFRGCRALVSVSVPDAVKSIGAFAFSDCTLLSSVAFTAQSQLRAIEQGAFARCISLPKFVIPLPVESMGMEVFVECASLTVYCKAAQRPDGWNVFWNGSGGTVYWSYTGY
ncbi:MAG: leucine-rich repeat domain-containing protein, partial [Clostridia bacterium]|nr:leucine-rich repeat domain-containing protein [Clostridia bacterium]